MNFISKLPFNIKVLLAIGISYFLILIAGFQLYQNTESLFQTEQQLFAELKKANLADNPEIQQTMKKADAAAAQSKLWIIYGLGGAVILGLVLSFIAVGNVHKLINTTLRGVAKKLKGASSQVAGISAEVSAACEVLAEGSSEQAASIEETSASLEELASMAKQNTENVRAAKSRANDARSSAEAGTQEMQQMSTVMDSMQVAGKELDRSMGEIKQSGDAISKIIKTIDEIAFQTNILALNAAVEAARAGEAGAGFAVVADEVRNLAKRSADAARETSALIENSISKSDQGVNMSHRVSGSLRQIIDSSRLVDKRLQEIVVQVREVDNYMNQVTESSEQQSQGVEQITLAVHQMDKVTQTSAASSEESAASAKDLNGQANVLKTAVHELLELIGADDKKGAPKAVNKTMSINSTGAVVTVKKSPSAKINMPNIQLQTTRLPDAPSARKSSPSHSHSLPAGDPNKSIPMDDFKDF